MSQVKRRRPSSATAEEEELTPFEQVCEELREIQWKTNCSTLTLQTVLDSLRGKLGKLVKEGELPEKVTHADKKMQSMVIFSFVCNVALSHVNYINHHRLGKRPCSYTDVWDKVVPKSGDLRMMVKNASYVEIIDMMTRTIPGNLSSTFHYAGGSKVCLHVLNTASLCDGSTTVRKTMMNTSQVCMYTHNIMLYVNILISWFVFCQTCTTVLPGKS